MKAYVYPAVLYQDKDGIHYLSIPDLNLLATGDNPEEAFVNGKDYIKSYFDLATRFDTIVPTPSSYEEICKRYPKNKVVMIDVAVKVNNPELTKEELQYKQFMQLFFDEDSEGGQHGKRKVSK